MMRPVRHFPAKGRHRTDRVLECVGLKDALVQSAGVVRDGGTISRVGAPQYPEVPFGFPEFRRNLTLTGGIAPARAYIEELMPHPQRRDPPRPRLRPHRAPGPGRC
jgi:threonine dehydrogenase-like Zn-dependent dehydrogenase